MERLMNIVLEFVPSWVCGESIPIKKGVTHIDFSFETYIQSQTDVNNYLMSQYDFFTEFLALDSKNPFTNPYTECNLLNLTDIYTMLMSTPYLVRSSPLEDAELSTASAMMTSALKRRESSLAPINGYNMGDSAESYVETIVTSGPLTSTRIFKKYVKFALSDNESKLFIIMTDTPEVDSYELDTDSHYNLRTSFIVGLFSFVKKNYIKSGYISSTTDLSKKFPMLSLWYHELLANKLG